MGAAPEHGMIDALTAHDIPAPADTAYQGSGPNTADELIAAVQALMIAST
jgi:hypothetical protein